MHCLDSYVNDIEPRIVSICENATSEEDPALQEALIAYCWILLDSWITWRTLRFLLKEDDIDSKIQRKWFKTPSSYTASQLQAVWKFPESSLLFLEEKIGNSLKHIIDKTVQPKRNSSAHYAMQNEVNGIDCTEIKKIFEAMSDTFLLRETYAFLKRLTSILSSKGYSDFRVQFIERDEIKLDEFKDCIDDFSKKLGYSLICRDIENEYCVVFTKSGCSAGKHDKGQNENDFSFVMNDSNKGYKFLDNKGFYQNIDSFASNVISCWNAGICESGIR